MLGKYKPRPVRDRSEEFASFTARPRAAAMATGLASVAPVQVTQKVKGRKSQPIRDAARDEPCTIALGGVCNGDPATSVWAHWPGLAADRGMGLKAIDLAGAVACSACHDALDGRIHVGLTRDELALAFLRGHLKSLVVLGRKGLL